MLARLLAKLQQFNLNLKHCPGLLHANADGLSRCHQCDRMECTPVLPSSVDKLNTNSECLQPHANSVCGSRMDSDLIPLESGCLHSCIKTKHQFANKLCCLLCELCGDVKIHNVILKHVQRFTTCVRTIQFTTN